MNLRTLPEKIKQTYRQFTSAQAGRRFLPLHERWGKTRNRIWLNLVAVGGGLLLIVVGFLLGLVPGVPGIVLGALGLALIGMRFRRVAVWLDRFEVKCRQWLAKWRRARAGH